MFLCNYHTHTTCCDGCSTVEETVRAALEKGFRALGFSGHGYMLYDTYGMDAARQAAYVRDVRRAQKAYEGRIELYLGVEADVLGEPADFAPDYIIGSVHSLETAGGILPVDYTAQRLERLADEHFAGDYYALCRAYFASVSRVKKVLDCQIIGHFDLVTKFNEGGRLFDEEDPRYLVPALEALDVLCRGDAAFEINTGAMARGYRSAPYPGPALLRAIQARGGAIVLSSDCHDCRYLDHGLAQAAQYARACGFTSRRVLTSGRWQEIGLE